MSTKLPAVIEDAEPRPDPRCYALAAEMLRGHPTANTYANRGFLAVAIWMEAKNTLRFILGEDR
jgi:hypothetical protein